MNVAVVLDINAAAISHPNGEGWHRLVVSNRDALELYRDLRIYFE